MSRTDLDSATLANALRHTAGDGSIEWVHEPMQASVLLDVADLLDESAKLRELVKDIYTDMWALGEWLEPYEQRMRELGINVRGASIEN